MREAPQSNIGHEIILVGSGPAAMYAYHQLIAQGHKVTIEQQMMSREYVITAREPSIELMKSASEAYYGWSPSAPNSKHHNGRYNKVNRKKNKASRKARKQTRR